MKNILSFVQTATAGVYKDIYDGIMSDPSNIVTWESNPFDKVENEKFAFISDSTFLQRQAARNCNMSLIAERFYKTGFGFAVPEGWPAGCMSHTAHLAPS